MLEELQQHDARVMELEVEAKAIPARLARLSEDVASVSAVLEREKVKLTETERYRSEQETQLRHEEQQLGKAKQKATQVKNQKEFMSLQREIETTRRLIGEREEEVLKLSEAVEAFRSKIASHEADVAKLREGFEAERAAGDARLAELAAQIAEHKKEREVVAVKVRADVRRKYDAIKLKKGRAVVPVKGGVCQGCNMRIPPQLYNILQRGNSLELCPTCARMIYWDRIMDEQKLEAGEAKPAE